jgi:hypothetical protein
VPLKAPALGGVMTDRKGTSIHPFVVLRTCVDKDGDGDISKEEFVQNAMNNEFIHSMLMEKA